MERRRTPILARVAAVIVCATALAGERNTQSTHPRPSAQSSDSFAGKEAALRGDIDDAILATGGGPRLRIKPVQVIPSSQGTIVGDTATLQGGPALLKFDVFFGGWGGGGSGLTTFQATVNPTGYSNGIGSPLGRPPNACTDPGGAFSPQCAAAFGGVVGMPADLRCNVYFVGECTNYYQETTRPDWPGANTPMVFNIPGASASIFSFGSATANPPLPDDGMEKYAGTFVLAADANARGTYTFTADPLDVGGNFMQTADGTVFQYAKIIPAKVTIPTGSCCFNLGPNTQCQDGVTEAQCHTDHSGAVIFRPGTLCPPAGPGCAPDCPLNPGICDDLDRCTIDTCDPVFDCQHELIPELTDPETQCCDPLTGKVADRFDTNQCTDDRCSHGGYRGVPQHNPVANGSPCDDGNSDTFHDRCDAGLCRGFEIPLVTYPYFRLVPVTPRGSAAPPYPAGTILDPTEGSAVFPNRPQRIWLELRMGGWGSQFIGGEPALLSVWQATFETVSANEYPGGLVRPFEPCTEGSDDAYCRSLMGNSGDILCGQVAGYSNRCLTVFNESGRADFVGPDFGLCAENAPACGGLSLGSVFGKADGGVEYYGGTVVVDAPADIAGTVTLGFHPADFTGNYMRLTAPDGDPANDVYLVPTLIPATLTFPTGRCCASPTTLPSQCWDSVSPGECEAFGPGTSFQQDATCQGDQNGDGADDSCALAIPAVSEWGLLVMSLILLALTKVLFGFRRPACGAARSVGR